MDIVFVAGHAGRTLFGPMTLWMERTHGCKAFPGLTIIDEYTRNAWPSRCLGVLMPMRCGIG